MSLDVDVYAVAGMPLAELRTRLPDSEQWSSFGEELAYEGEGWQVLVGEAEETEEVPEDLSGLLPDARYLMPLTLEPIGAPEKGQAFLEQGS